MHTRVRSVGKLKFENRCRLALRLNFWAKERTLWTAESFVSLSCEWIRFFEFHWWCCRWHNSFGCKQTMTSDATNDAPAWRGNRFVGQTDFGVSYVTNRSSRSVNGQWFLICPKNVRYESRKILHSTFSIALRWFNVQSLNRTNDDDTAMMVSSKRIASVQAPKVRLIFIYWMSCEKKN